MANWFTPSCWTLDRVAAIGQLPAVDAGVPIRTPTAIVFVRTGRGRQTLIWICPPASPDAAKSGVGDEMSVPGS